MAPEDQRLFDIAKRLCNPETTYHKDELMKSMLELTKGDLKRARSGLNMMLKCGAIEATLTKDYYFLGGSTPF